MGNKIIYLEGDLGASAKFKESVAIDTETTGLSLVRDRLCLVQLADSSGRVYIIKVAPPYKCPNLRALLSDKSVQKIFHFARFDMAMIRKCLGITMENVFCTKIASRLCRTSTDRHSLKAVVAEFFGVELNKDEQTSDWAGELSERQIEYAANDVIYLHRIRDEMERRLKREGRGELARRCFAFLATRVELDLAGWGEVDIFAH
ncbi:MAG: ribonuclease D [Rickettsiales bacterium]|jgi:ribonuclease D|nr:ribonuclease D [Rickettsiales bacterium]